MQKEFIGFIGCTFIGALVKEILQKRSSSIINKFIFQGRDVAKEFYEKSRQASIIQRRWRVSRNAKKLTQLSQLQITLIRMMVVKYINRKKRELNAKRARKIYLIFFHHNLSKKIAQKIHSLKNQIIP